MRVAVVDIGTNSTRLLVADVEPDGDGGRVTELDRRSTVTRLGQGVDATGRLPTRRWSASSRRWPSTATRSTSPAPSATVAVLTSAVRDAENGAEFTRRVARATSASTRARSPATRRRASRSSARPASATRRTRAGRRDRHRRRLDRVRRRRGRRARLPRLDPGRRRAPDRAPHPRPTRPRRRSCSARRRVRATIIDARGPRRDPERTTRGDRASPGTATSLAAIDQELEPYDPARVHGYVLTARAAERLLALLAGMTDAQRREVPGAAPRPRPDDRRRRGDPGRGAAGLRPRSRRGLRARHPARRRAGSGASRALTTR